MSKRKSDGSYLREIEDEVDEGVLDQDEESDCSEDEDFETMTSSDAPTLSVRLEGLASTASSSESEFSEGNLSSASGNSDDDSEEPRGATKRTGHNGTYWSENPPPSRTLSSASENSDDDSEEPWGATNRVGRNGTYWSENPPPPSRTQRHNILRQNAGTKSGVQTYSPRDAFKLFLTEEIIEEVCRCTNLEGKRVATSKRKKWKTLSKEEVSAYLGLVILAGCERQWDVPTRELFGNEFSNPFYKATMSVERFEDIRRFMRFDDKRTRAVRLQTDHMAAFRYIWHLFISNCSKWYYPSECVTIDEQLVPYRGRCKFIQYMPSKPGKYGIKIFWLCDSTTYHGFNGIVYTGRQPGEAVRRNLGYSIVQELCTPLRHSGRNVTMDNFFTGVQLAQSLLEKSLTLVGTLRKNKPDIPPIMKATKSRQLHSTEFGFNGNISMASYVPKKGRAVILLSTIHHDRAIDEESRKKKPAMITYYNKTECGVDTFDQMIGTYTCKRQTRRWPLIMWYNMLDVAALNAFVVFTDQHPEYESGKSHKRRLFLKELA